MPLTAPIRPSAKAHTFSRWIVRRAAADPVRRHQVAEAGRVGVPLAGELVGHDAVRARRRRRRRRRSGRPATAAGRRRPGRARTSPPSAAAASSSPSRRAIASAAATRRQPQRARRTRTARASATCRRSGRAGRRARAGRRRRGRTPTGGSGRRPPSATRRAISASPASGPAATASRQAWRTNFGPEVLPVVDVLERVPVGADERVVLRAADVVRDGAADLARRPARRTPRSSRSRVVDRDRLEQVADPAQLQLGEQLEQRERGVEVDVDRVVERVVDALEEREPADVVGIRLRAADLAGSQNEPPSTRKYSSLNSAIVYQSGRSGSSRTGACQASIAASPGRGLGEGVPREVDRARRRSGPTPACSASTSGGRRRTRRPAGPRRSRTGPSGARPGPSTNVAATAAPDARSAGRPPSDGPPPGSQPPVGGEVRPKLPVGDRIERRARAQLHAVAAQCRDRRACRAGRSARRRRRRRAPRRACLARATTRWGRGAAGPVAANGSAQVNRSPTVSGSGPGFSDPPLEHPDGQGAPLEVAGR